MKKEHEKAAHSELLFFIPIFIDQIRIMLPAARSKQ